MGGKEDERKIEDQNVADMASTAPAGLGKHGLDKNKEGALSDKKPTKFELNLLEQRSVLKKRIKSSKMP